MIKARHLEEAGQRAGQLKSLLIKLCKLIAAQLCHRDGFANFKSPVNDTTPGQCNNNTRVPRPIRGTPSTLGAEPIDADGDARGERIKRNARTSRGLKRLDPVTLVAALRAGARNYYIHVERAP